MSVGYAGEVFYRPKMHFFLLFVFGVLIFLLEARFSDWSSSSKVSSSVCTAMPTIPNPSSMMLAPTLRKALSPRHRHFYQLSHLWELLHQHLEHIYLFFCEASNQRYGCLEYILSCWYVASTRIVIKTPTALFLIVWKVICILSRVHLHDIYELYESLWRRFSLSCIASNTFPITNGAGSPLSVIVLPAMSSLFYSRALTLSAEQTWVYSGRLAKTQPQKH